MRQEGNNSDIVALIIETFHFGNEVHDGFTVVLGYHISKIQIVSNIMN